MNKCLICKSHDKELIKKIGAYNGTRPIFYYICDDCEKDKWIIGIERMREESK